MKHAIEPTRYSARIPDDRPTIPASPSAKRLHSGVRRRSPVDALLLEYLDESEAPDTVPRPALASALAAKMRDE